MNNKKFNYSKRNFQVRQRMEIFRSPEKIHLRKLLTDYKDILLARLTKKTCIHNFRLQIDQGIKFVFFLLLSQV